jgi:hypothetical protein
MKPLKSITASLAALIVLAIGMPYALAQVTHDVKTMAGYACKPIDGSEVASVTYNPDSLYNPTFANVVVVCPIERDNSNNTTGLWSADVVISNAFANVAFNCQLNSYSEDGVLQQNSSVGTTAAGVQTLSFNVNTSTINGFYSLLCTVPPFSDLISYRWADPVRTDRNN